jgi:HPt (histidine-containing phosphotransfer) domain-containing protein
VSRVIDRTQLDRLAARFGADFVARMIDLFVSQGEERIVAAQGALAAGDVPAITAAAHGLKSSAGNIGAMALMEQSDTLERRGRAGDSAAELASLVSEVAFGFEQARSELEALRSGLR